VWSYTICFNPQNSKQAKTPHGYESPVALMIEIKKLQKRSKGEAVHWSLTAKDAIVSSIRDV
jgi:hypothetical protein